MKKFEDIMKTAYSADDFEYKFSDLAKVKECPICHKKFVPQGRNASRQRYCKRTHYIDCQICGKPIAQIPPSEKYGSVRLACRGECTNKFRIMQMNASVKEKYGVDNISQCAEFKEKISAGLKAKAEQMTENRKQTMQEKYGGMGTASPELRQKIEGTIQEKYGVKSVSELPEIREKIRKRLSSKEAINKRVKSSQSKWSVDYPSQLKEIQERMQQTCLEHWGVPYSGQVPGSREKAKQTCLEKYGTSCYLNTDEARQKAKEAMIENQTGRVSKINLAFLELLATHNIVAETEFYLNHKWYDIVIPSDKIVVEINPSYTHSLIANHWSEGKDSYYHLERTRHAEKEGYRCIHIFEWESWDKVISLLSAKERIYARNCKVQLISKDKADEFIENYHIQGKVTGTQFAYGLFYSDELVEVMTFGRPRYNKNHEYELLRLCTDSNYHVVGGASKLFRAFIEDQQPRSIISYCDRSKFTGHVYSQIGMKLDHSTPPAKVWSKDDQKITDNLLRQRGYDQLFGTSYGKGTSNEELMLANGWLPVCDCGQEVFVWTKGDDDV